jgi:hypothetical protein
VGHASRSSALLRIEATLARISQSDLKTDGDVTMGGECDTIMWHYRGGCVGDKLKTDGSMR